jgi:hypothetical protein
MSTMSSEPVSGARLTNTLGHVGSAVRYTFYAIGAIALAIVGTFFWSAKSLFDVPVKVDARPSFHLASQHLARFSARTQVVTGGRFGRMELLQYGSFHNRDVNFTIGMGFPPAGAVFGRDPAPQISSLMPRNVRTLMSSNYHDLETRFGPVRATEVRLESDGQWKQCLAFASRFDTPSMYLIGWSCDARGAKPSPERLACMIDRLTLDRDLASKEADTFLRARLAQPASCSAIPVSQTTDMRSRSGISSPQRWSTPNAQQRRY